MIYAYEINGTIQARNPDLAIKKIHEKLDPVTKYCRIQIYGERELITG